MQASPSGPLSKTWCARAPAHASTHRSSGGGWMALTWPWRTHGCIAFQAATIATVGAYEVGQKKSASPQTPGTSADHKRLLMVDASATNRCTCEEDCLDGCDICEKELHKKKMQRIEARHHICLCSNDNKHGESWSDEPCGGNILICIGPTRDGERCERALCVRHFRALDEGGNRHGSLCSQCHGWACSQCIRACGAYTSWHTCPEHPAELCPMCVKRLC